MAGFTTAMPTSLKKEFATGTHDFTITTGDDFKCALGKSGPTGTYGAATVNYSDITGNSDENTGTNYSAGGFDFTAANNITPQTSGTTAYWQWNVNPSWTTATITTPGCIIYNASKSNKAVYVGSFGGDQSVIVGTLTLVQPSNTNTTALLRIQ
jgi:hypothetical protein